MAHQGTIVENGMTYNVTEFDHTAQEIDDAVSNLGGASTPQGAIAALGAGVRPKLNDNPFFLVNQRGQSSYTGPGYGPDRWLVTGSHKLDMLDGGGVKLTVVSGANANQMIQQYLEPEIFEQINGKQVTLAAIVTENSMSLPTYFRVGTAAYGHIPAGQTGLFFATATINYKTGQNYIGFQCSDRANQNGQSISLRAFTAEEGSIQTLGYQDSSGVLQLLEHPDPLEVLKCQRYQFTFANAMRIRASRITNSEINFFIPLPTGLRTTPTIVNAQNLQVYSPTGGAAQTGFAFSCPSGSAAFGNGVTIVATKSSHGLQDAFLYTNTPGGANLITLDANL